MTSSPPSPSGTVSGLSGGGATHCPEPSWQSSPDAQVPQDLPHSLPHCRPSQAGVHSRHSPQGALGPPQLGGSITVVAHSQGRQEAEPSGRSRQQSPAPHTMSLEQEPPRSQTPRHRPPIPSLGSAQVALEQSGIAMQGPVTVRPGPQIVGSLDGHRGSTQAKRDARPRGLPACSLHTSPVGQVIGGSCVGSQASAHSQLGPQGLSGLPQSPSARSMTSSHSAGQQTLVARA